MQPVCLLESNLKLTRGESASRYFFLSILAIMILFSLLCQKVSAAEQYSDISAPLLKHLMKTDKKVVVIHVLSDIDYEIHHITGSISIPINKVAGSAKLPKDKDTPLIFYCMGHR